MAIKEHEAAAPPTGKMTYEEFLDWADEDTWAEWVDGEVIMLSPASDRHQNLVRFLMRVIDPIVEARQLGTIRSAPFAMHLPAIQRVREPDLLFVRQEHIARVQENVLEGPADLVIEVASPSTIHVDRGEKYVEYEAAGISEYWLIDPLRQVAEFYRLGADGRYRPVLPDSAGVFHSETIPDFWLRVDWLWEEPLPPAEAIAIEVGGTAHVRAITEAILRAGGTAHAQTVLQTLLQTLGADELRRLLSQLGSPPPTS